MINSITYSNVELHSSKSTPIKRAVDKIFQVFQKYILKPVSQAIHSLYNFIAKKKENTPPQKEAAKVNELVFIGDGNQNGELTLLAQRFKAQFILENEIESKIESLKGKTIVKFCGIMGRIEYGIEKPIERIFGIAGRIGLVFYTQRSESGIAGQLPTEPRWCALLNTTSIPGEIWEEDLDNERIVFSKRYSIQILNRNTNQIEKIYS